MKNLYLFVFLIGAIYSCNKYPPDIKETLKIAGQNKSELEKVLDYYSRSPDDSFKFKAACFLIRNLQWHSSKQVKLPDKVWDEYLFEDSLSKAKIGNPADTDLEHYFYTFKIGEKKKRIKQYLQDVKISSITENDIHTISSDFLIHTIDCAFAVRNLPWNKNLSFDEFCEYILPYRLTSEPVFDIRQKLFTQFQSLAKNDTIINDPIKAATAINRYINYFNWDWDDLNIDLPDLGFYSIFFWNINKLTCANHLAIEGQILRSAGIPVIEIFTPKWKINNLGHNWCGLLSNDKKIIPFSPIWQDPGIQRDEHSLDKASKLYMKTFGAQKDSPFYLKSATETIPELFSSPCIKDVTNQFVPTHDIELKLDKSTTSNNLCYFCLFIYREWEPVGWGEIDHKSGTVCFKNIPEGIVGLPCIFKNNEMVPIGKLIKTESKGGYKLIEPSNDLVSIHLTRKYPPKAGLQYFNNMAIGTIIEASNEENFKHAVKLSTLSDTLRPYFQDYTFSNPNKYRYYRLTAPGYSLHFAELEFLTSVKKKGSSEASSLPIFNLSDTITKPAFKLTGVLIGDRKDEFAFDHNPLTYTFQRTLTVDFGQPEQINTIRILPRNADNGISIGDIYELYYWNNGWKYFGATKAKYNFVQFEHVPAGTIYWLKNTTKGHEEQAFFYSKGQQIFINNN